MKINIRSRSTSLAALKKNYDDRRLAIRKRLAEFKAKLSRPEGEIFAELCFCLLTPQSKAKTCWAAIENLKKKKLLLSRAPAARLAREIKGVRFQNNKARYLCAARAEKTRFCGAAGAKRLAPAADGEIRDFREELVARIKGYGHKEASHFLRNIGLGGGLAILDRHILKNLVKYGAIKKIPPTISGKNYILIENKMRRFAALAGIPMDELDLLFWSEETGEIFK